MRILAETGRRMLAGAAALCALGASAQEGTTSNVVPLQPNEPMYFIVGTRGETTARFQLSFKYRLFDSDKGWGVHVPQLARLHFAYTQTTVWNLSDDSKPFHDTSYRPSFFWAREGEPGDWLPVQALRLGVEHESNGQSGTDSRSINILFVRPEWRWALEDGRHFEFTPKVYGYLDKEENPDIQKYRGYVDWRFRYGTEERSWVAMARVGTSGKGSLTLDWFELARGRGPGLVGGYFHVQFFTGYGEDILDYNKRYKSQIRFGFALVP